MTGRQKEVKRHLTPGELAEAIDDAQQADEARLVRRLICLNTLYRGDTLAEAAQHAAVNPTTVDRWVIDGMKQESIDCGRVRRR